MAILSSSHQFIHVKAISRVTNHVFHFTVVYGFNTLAERKPLWKDLISFADPGTPWLVFGDFNAVLSPDDRYNGAAISDYEVRDFADCLLDAGLAELTSKGHFYSWSSKGQGSKRVSSRIDRCFANGLWFSAFPRVFSLYLAPGFSDHSPIFIDCS